MKKYRYEPLQLDLDQSIGFPHRLLDCLMFLPMDETNGEGSFQSIKNYYVIPRMLSRASKVFLRRREVAEILANIDGSSLAAAQLVAEITLKSM